MREISSCHMSCSWVQSFLLASELLHNLLSSFDGFKILFLPLFDLFFRGMDDKGILGSGWNLNSQQWKVVVAARVEKNEMTVRSEYTAGLPIKLARALIF